MKIYYIRHFDWSNEGGNFYNSNYCLKKETAIKKLKEMFKEEVDFNKLNNNIVEMVSETKFTIAYGSYISDEFEVAELEVDES